MNDCHQFAQCQQVQGGFTCHCNDGFADVSPDPQNKPGRVCVRAVNECAANETNTCDQNADCEDLLQGYTCHCRQGDAAAGAGP